MADMHRVRCRRATHCCQAEQRLEERHPHLANGSNRQGRRDERGSQLCRTSTEFATNTPTMTAEAIARILQMAASYDDFRLPSHKGVIFARIETCSSACPAVAGLQSLGMDGPRFQRAPSSRQTKACMG